VSDAEIWVYWCVLTGSMGKWSVIDKDVLIFLWYLLYHIHMVHGMVENFWIFERKERSTSHGSRLGVHLGRLWGLKTIDFKFFFFWYSSSNLYFSNTSSNLYNTHSKFYNIKIIPLESITSKVSKDIYFIVHILYYIGQNDNLRIRVELIYRNGESI
jgi:hypothetical protein